MCSCTNRPCRVATANSLLVPVWRSASSGMSSGKSIWRRTARMFLLGSQVVERPPGQQEGEAKKMDGEAIPEEDECETRKKAHTGRHMDPSGM
mmetsp:Transcript_56650/g.132943  ORF Transcript_56650/g.132943 Transcript_56650/m.132943 type:complete len:93 (+) Transcript_56650:1007-1285(+)